MRFKGLALAILFFQYISQSDSRMTKKQSLAPVLERVSMFVVDSINMRTDNELQQHIFLYELEEFWNIYRIELANALVIKDFEQNELEAVKINQPQFFKYCFQHNEMIENMKKAIYMLLNNVTSSMIVQRAMHMSRNISSEGQLKKIGDIFTDSTTWSFLHKVHMAKELYPVVVARWNLLTIASVFLKTLKFNSTADVNHISMYSGVVLNDITSLFTTALVTRKEHSVLRLKRTNWIDESKKVLNQSQNALDNYDQLKQELGLSDFTLPGENVAKSVLKNGQTVISYVEKADDFLTKLNENGGIPSISWPTESKFVTKISDKVKSYGLDKQKFAFKISGDTRAKVAAGFETVKSAVGLYKTIKSGADAQAVLTQGFEIIKAAGPLLQMIPGAGPIIGVGIQLISAFAFGSDQQASPESAAIEAMSEKMTEEFNQVHEHINQVFDALSNQIDGVNKHIDAVSQQLNDHDSKMITLFNQQTVRIQGVESHISKQILDLEANFKVRSNFDTIYFMFEAFFKVKDRLSALQLMEECNRGTPTKIFTVLIGINVHYVGRTLLFKGLEDFFKKKEYFEMALKEQNYMYRAFSDTTDFLLKMYYHTMVIVQTCSNIEYERMSKRDKMRAEPNRLVALYEKRYNKLKDTAKQMEHEFRELYWSQDDGIAKLIRDRIEGANQSQIEAIIPKLLQKYENWKPDEQGADQMLNYVAVLYDAKNDNDKFGITLRNLEDTFTSVLTCGMHNALYAKVICSTAAPFGKAQENSSVSSHMFYLAFENSVCMDYITEKFYNARYLVVPVVLKREIYKNYIPDDMYIAADDFESPKALGEYMNYLTTNTTAYMEYFAWTQKYEVVTDFPEICQLCEDLYEKTPRQIPNIVDHFITSSKCDGEFGQKLLKPKETFQTTVTLP